jgi:hypothetical protein
VVDWKRRRGVILAALKHDLSILKRKKANDVQESNNWVPNQSSMKWSFFFIIPRTESLVAVVLEAVLMVLSMGAIISRQ